MEEALTNHLLAGIALAALVAPRITWATRPQASALPAVVLHKISGSPLYADDGKVGLSNARIQVDSWGRTYAEAKGVAREVEARLSSQTGRFTSGNFYFPVSFLEDEQDSFERGAGGEDLYRVRQDFIITYKET